MLMDLQHSSLARSFLCQRARGTASIDSAGVFILVLVLNAGLVSALLNRTLFNVPYAIVI